MLSIGTKVEDMGNLKNVLKTFVLTTLLSVLSVGCGNGTGQSQPDSQDGTTETQSDGTTIDSETPSSTSSSTDVETESESSSEENPLDHLRVLPQDIELKIGERQLLFPRGVLRDGTEVPVDGPMIWQSSDKEIAAVKTDGEVIAKSSGTVTITGSLVEELIGIKGQTTVTVLPDPVCTSVSIKHEGEDTQINIGESMQFEALCVTDEGTTINVTEKVKWKSGDTGVLTINSGEESGGLALGRGAGEVDVWAVYTNEDSSSVESEKVALTVINPYPIPQGCERLTPANANAYGFTGRESINDGYAVWRWIDANKSPSQTILMARELATGENRELLRVEYPKKIDKPAIYNGIVYFEREVDAGAAMSKEIFAYDIGKKTEKRLTFNDAADADITGGGGGFILFRYFFEDKEGLKIWDVSEQKEKVLSDDMMVLQSTSDGERWVANFDGDYLVYYDHQRPEQGMKKMIEEKVEEWGYSFNRDTGEFVGGFYQKGYTDAFDLVVWDFETNEREILAGGPYSQGFCDASGFVIAYQDSAASGGHWSQTKKAEVKIIDRETKVTRKVLHSDTWYGLGIWSHYIATNNYGKWGDSLIVCDLKEMGLMDEQGHVVPE